ncbi:MAG: hypothetical protein AAF478_12055 [Pseudomonadota bacterium]
MYVGSNGSDFAAKLLGYLQKADYQVASSSLERQRIFRLRYEAYLREGAINENRSMMFHDTYDNFENCWIFGIFLEDKLASSIRCHVISPEWPKGPALDVFPDIIGPMVHDQGLTIVDPTRFVADHRLAKEYPEIPFMALRAACMTYDYFEADYCLATVRQEHAAFYRRVFRAEMVCEPRPYPTLNAPICLMKTNVASFRDKLLRRYPIFESSFTERRMIFENSPVFNEDTPLANVSSLAG